MMKHIFILYVFILIVLSSFVSSAYSTDRTDYYYNSSSGWYMTDGIETIDIALNGTPVQADEDFLNTYGWTNNEMNYDNAKSYIGDYSIRSDDSSGHIWINNGSFTGTVGFTLWENMSVTYSMTIGGWSVGADVFFFTGLSDQVPNCATEWCYYSAGLVACDNNSIQRKEETWTDIMWAWNGTTDTIHLYINNTLCHVETGKAGLRDLRLFQDGIGTNVWWIDDFYISNGDRPLDISPPKITVLSPDTTYNETYNADIWINFTTDESATCSLNNTAFDVFSSDGVDFRYNESSLPDSFYAVNISCYDLSNNLNSTIVYFTKDTEIPSITSTFPLEDNSSLFNNTGSINITFLLGDNIDLFVYNVSIEVLSSGMKKYNNSLEISGTSYLFSELVNTTDWDDVTYKEIVRVCDSHTALLIKEAEEIIKQYDTLKFQFDDINVDIRSIGGSEISTDTTKLGDRYTFKFNYDKVTSSKTYELSSSHKISYLPDSKYKGHFILGNILWIDFSNEGKVTVEKSGDNYLITVENSGQSIEFNSIGYLNCIEEHYQFELAGVCENVICTDYTACQPDVSGGLQDCTAVNESGCFYAGNYTEFQLACDYCIPIFDTNVFCAGWSGTCPTNYTEYCLDINNTCYDETGASSDIYGSVTRGCVGTYSSGDIPEVTIDMIVGTLAVIFSLVSLIALALIFGWVIKKYKGR